MEATLQNSQSSAGTKCPVICFEEDNEPNTVNSWSNTVKYETVSHITRRWEGYNIVRLTVEVWVMSIMGLLWGKLMALYQGSTVPTLSLEQIQCLPSSRLDKIILSQGQFIHNLRTLLLTTHSYNSKCNIALPHCDIYCHNVDRVNIKLYMLPWQCSIGTWPGWSLTSNLRSQPSSLCSKSWGRNVNPAWEMKHKVIYSVHLNFRISLSGQTK